MTLILLLADEDQSVASGIVHRRRFHEWIMDAIYMPNAHKLVLGTSARELRFYDVATAVLTEEVQLYGAPLEQRKAFYKCHEKSFAFVALPNVPMCFEYYHDQSVSTKGVATFKLILSHKKQKQHTVMMTISLMYSSECPWGIPSFRWRRKWQRYDFYLYLSCRRSFWQIAQPWSHPSEQHLLLSERTAFANETAFLESMDGRHCHAWSLCEIQVAWSCASWSCEYDSLSQRQPYTYKLQLESTGKNF